MGKTALRPALPCSPRLTPSKKWKTYTFSPPGPSADREAETLDTWTTAPVDVSSREACELLRTMRPATVNQIATKRDLAEREAVILDKMTELAQALFNYDSAAGHADPHLRDIAWRRKTPCRRSEQRPAWPR